MKYGEFVSKVNGNSNYGDWDQGHRDDATMSSNFIEVDAAGSTDISNPTQPDSLVALRGGAESAG